MIHFRIGVRLHETIQSVLYLLMLVKDQFRKAYISPSQAELTR